MKNKKRLLNIGVVTFSFIPIITTIACNDNGVQTYKTQEIEKNQNKQNSKKIKIYDLSKPLKLNGKVLQVVDDMAILSNEYYTGNIKNKNADNWRKMGVRRKSWTSNASMLGKGDAIIFVFDNDDNDGLSTQNFAATHYFQDTSLMWNINKFNTSSIFPGLIKRGWSTFLPFYKINATKGAIKPWYGSQSNHVIWTFQEAMKKIKKIYPTNIYKKIENYYKRFSKAFKPVAISSDLFTYEQIASNAIALRFNPYQDFALTASFIYTIPIINGSKRIQWNKKSIIGPLSIGGQEEWKYYNKNPYKRTLFATKFNNAKKLISSTK